MRNDTHEIINIINLANETRSRNGDIDIIAALPGFLMTSIATADPNSELIQRLWSANIRVIIPDTAQGMTVVEQLRAARDIISSGRELEHPNTRNGDTGPDWIWRQIRIAFDAMMSPRPLHGLFLSWLYPRRRSDPDAARIFDVMINDICLYETTRVGQHQHLTSHGYPDEVIEKHWTIWDIYENK